jgi:glycosyltransferase involved in cell wall biosynthesis
MAEEMYTIFPRKYDVITNGFDYEDCILPAETKPDKKFSIAHIGTMVKTRNPHTLWKVLSSLIMENQDFANDLEIKLVGKADFSVLDAINENGLRKYLSKIDYMPHDEVIRVQQQSQVLLLVINNTPNAVSILTGKFFEYLAARRPIICIGPSNGDAAKILNETKAGYALDYENYDGLKAIIEQYYQLYKRGNLKTNNIGYERFSRKMLTQKLAGILQSIS